MKVADQAGRGAEGADAFDHLVAEALRRFDPGPGGFGVGVDRRKLDGVDDGAARHPVDQRRRPPLAHRGQLLDEDFTSNVVLTARFPVEHLPTWAQKLSLLFPLTHLVAALRQLSFGLIQPGIAWNLAVLVIMFLGFFPLSLITMRRRLIR